MGWLELLPLLRRLLPLLSQITPTLESLLAGRAGARAEAEQTKAAIAGLAGSHTGLLQRLDQQDAALSELRASLRTLHADAVAGQEQAAALQHRLNAVHATVRVVALLAGSALLACIAVLVFMIVRLH